MDRHHNALEVIVSWGDSPEWAEVFASPRRIRVGGGPDADVLLPPEVAAEPHDLLEAEGDDWVLTIPTWAQATIEVKEGGNARGVDPATLPANPDGLRRLRIGDATTVELTSGAFRFLVRTTERVEGALPHRPIDWTAWRWVGASLLFHGALLGIFLLQPPEAGALSLELGRDDARYLATYLAVDESHPPEPETTVEGDAGSDTGGGQPQDGDEGTTGAADETRSTGGGVQVQGHDREPRVPTTADDVRNMHVLGTLAQLAEGLSGISSPFGDPNARGWSDEDAYGPLLAGMPGFGPGSGGFGMVGTGRGGCPRGAPGCGRGTVGMGEFGGIGTGCSRAEFDRLEARYGRAGAMDRCSRSGHRAAGVTDGMRRSGRTPPRISVGPTETSGGLGAEQVRRVVRRNLAQVRHCYEQALTSRPDLEGRVTVQWVIQPSGAVQASQIVGTDLGHGGVEGCVADAVRRWPFPQSDGVTIVSYPFRFARP